MRPMKWFHALSLDVVIGALAVGLFASRVLQVSPPWCWWTVLAASVWSVYTADHLLDGNNRGTASQMFRHQLHYRKQHVFLFFLILIAIYAITSSMFCFKWPVIFWGVALGGLVLFYLLFVFVARKNQIYFQKELFVSLIYVLGIWFAPLIWHGVKPGFAILMILIIFFLFGWADGLLIASLDRQRDRDDHQQSFATFYGQLKTHRLIIFILALSGVLSFGGLFFQNVNGIRAAFALLFFMDLVLLLLFIAPVRFSKSNFYRFFLEAIFWLPAGVIFWI